MALVTSFPGEYPFYGGIAPAWGTGIHEDYDPLIRKGEVYNADMVNRVEKRIERIEDIVHQVEHEFLYPSGSVATSGIAESVPASGNYYVRSRLDECASGINRLIEALVAEGTIPGDTFSAYYPIYVGTV